MASNPIPNNSAQLIGLGTKNHAGLVALGSSLGITQITPAQYQTTLTAFINADGEANAAHSATLAASQTFQETKDSLAGWLQETRNVLAARFGSRWSTMWAQAGFIAPSTKVPARQEEKLGLALKLANFFTANPSYEVASMDITAAEATSLRNAAIAAQQAFATAKVTQVAKIALANAARAALVKLMRGLIKILGYVLAPDDPRWQTFGFNMPAAKTTPGQPQNVTASDAGAGDTVVQWDAAPLATHYRVRMLRIGIDLDYVLAARARGTMALIHTLLPGQTALIIVQAVNGTQQGAASEPIEFTLPEADASRRDAATMPDMAAVSGNGSHNGSVAADTSAPALAGARV